jgi:ABC-type multidrug transport system fused ATPase/permease subunit
VRLADARAIWRLLRPQRWRVAALVLLCVLQAVSLIPVTVLIARIFEHEIPRGQTGAILVSGVEMLGIYAVWVGVTLAAQWTILTVAARASLRLRGQLIDHVYEMPTAWHARQDVGILRAIVVEDGLRAEYLVIAALTSAAALAVCALLVVLACYLAPLPALLLMVIVPALLKAHRRFGRAVTVRAEQWRLGANDYSSRVGRALRTLRAARVRGADVAEHQARLAELLRANQKMLARNWLQAVSSTTQGAITAVAGLSVLVIGGCAVAARWMSLGDLAAFYAVLALALRQGATASSQGAAILADLPSLKAVHELLEDRLEPPYAGTVRAAFDGSVELSGVSFGYDERLVLDDVSLTISPGEVVALVGANGSGKSTLASLLLGLYAPSAGAIRMGGRDIAELDLVDLRRQIGVVEQEPVLLPTSVRENIAWGRPTAADSEIVEAAARAGALEIRGLDVLDEDVRVGEDGTLLSGGQRQRIVVARALLGNPSLLILDEPTNHLDEAAVAKLLETLGDLDPAPAVLIITHDIAVAAQARRQYLLSGGRVVNTRTGERQPLALGSRERA